MTGAFERLSAVLLADPEGPHYGFDLCRTTQVRPRVLYPILARMLEAGWLSDGWEDADLCRVAGREPRRFYRLNDAGRMRLRDVVPH